MAENTIKPNIEVKDLNLVYNSGKPNEIKGLENINLKIFSHEYVIIFGPSGCGKSTLLYAIAGFHRPTGGEIVVDGEDINSFDEKRKVEFRRNRIGMVFQSFFLVPTLTVLDNVCLPKIFLNADFSEREKKGLELLERFGIREQAEKFPAELSGGQKQRVAIARALVNNPDILIADEPVGNLDSKSSFNVMTILRELNEKDKKTIILVTHDPAHLSFGNKVVFMSDGKISKTEEVVERKEAVLKGEEEVLVKKEMINPEIQMLMRSFRNFSPSQVGMLLIPFKAQQFLSHIFFNVSDEQIEIARNKLQEVVSGKISADDFEKILDTPFEKGGAGWDKRTAHRLASRLREIMECSQKIDLSAPEKSANVIGEYIQKLFELELIEDQKIKLLQLIRLRIENKLSVVELRKGLDRPESERGMGMDRRTAGKVAREVEILLLARFS